MNYTINSRIKYKLGILSYILLINVLMVNAYGETFKYSHGGQMFIYDFNSGKFILGIVETAVLYRFVCQKYEKTGLTDVIVLFFDLLYFIPGVVQQAATNSKYEYMFFFFLFRLGIEMWVRIIKPKSVSIIAKRFKTQNPKNYILIITILAVLSIIGISVYSGNYFSFSNIVATLNDIYGVRATYKENAMHWILVNIEYFSVYYLMLMIAYYTERRKWILVGICFFAEFNAFLIQANRIVLFLSVIAFLIGLIKDANRKIYIVFAILGLLLVIEVLVNIRGYAFTDVYRRYSIVPNRLSEQYYDFFKTHAPDYLRSKYDRIARIIGMRSKYLNPSIGVIIGQTYYNTGMNCNNGLVGGGMFMFGYLAPIITTFGYVMAFRLFETVTSSLKNTSIITCLAIVLTTLSINIGTMLANIFSLSYILLLYLVMIPINKAYLKDYRINSYGGNYGDE